MKNLFERIMDPAFYKMLFGDKTGILQAKKDMLELVCKLFRDWFSQSPFEMLVPVKKKGSY